MHFYFFICKHYILFSTLFPTRYILWLQFQCKLECWCWSKSITTLELNKWDQFIMKYSRLTKKITMIWIVLKSWWRSRRCWWSRWCSWSLRSFEWRCLVVGENNVARVISMQDIFHHDITWSHQLLITYWGDIG